MPALIPTLRSLSPLLLLALPHPVLADTGSDTLTKTVTAILAEAGPGTRFGMVVADDQGRELLAIDPEGRYMPASNTKIYTTSAAYYATGGTLALPGGGAAVRLEKQGRHDDVVLVGNGDARLSSADDCKADCLATLADAVAAKTRHVRDMIGDDTLFPDQRWSPGMSWNNVAGPYGTGISALTLDDNELLATIRPGVVGHPPQVSADYYTVRNEAQTVPGTANNLIVDRLPGSRELLVSGTLGVDAGEHRLRLGIDDPADHAAWRLAQMLRDRGVEVSGTVRVRHRLLQSSDDPTLRGLTPITRPTALPMLAQVQEAPVSEDVVTTNKTSQNLHAELILRRTALLHGNGSIADGQAEVRTMLTAAGVTDAEASFADGSGMSTYNRVAPRGTVKLLEWIARQPWGANWRASLPVGGVDGTLRRRFANMALQGRIDAKTGTLAGTNALAGYVTAASGRTLTFAIYANDVPDGLAATPLMDRAIAAVAAAE
ncbi:D-alanyl-D-alanine carboxypeptidase/D-alanyl-D-alanine-endopeptidase [Novosphingobium sp. 9]|uniref:D-alanyl-D-alanine carboxypeptidase/D-alanyl-D-alanine endopeptidase n=1 Tax=Novosphingobium sp. 9 TaxID=2025349 RepID=UPI0021B6C2F6|nr:D-alanyl-D-alanine carboxypeptidase/D-alanyl-D-alanine-endopeptidase [Novosphingobium sp. 9]